MLEVMDQVEKAKKLLESKGFQVKVRKPKTVAKTFQITEDVLNQFVEKCAQREVKLRVAIDEALADWIKKNGR